MERMVQMDLQALVVVQELRVRLGRVELMANRAVQVLQEQAEFLVAQDPVDRRAHRGLLELTAFQVLAVRQELQVVAALVEQMERQVQAERAGLAAPTGQVEVVEPQAVVAHLA